MHHESAQPDSGPPQRVRPTRLGSKHSSHLSSGLNLFAIGTTTVTAYRLQLGAAGAS